MSGRNGRNRRDRRNNDDAGLGCVIMLLLAVIALPLFGIYLISKEDETTKIIGVILTIIGAILWIWLYFGSR